MSWNPKILITGGTGSIGLAIARKYAMSGYPADNLRLLTNDENSIFENQGKGKVIFGDIRDPSRLKYAMKGIDFVFHAAAMKHIDICEDNPFDAVETNVIGTKNVIQAAIDANVKKFIFISTDKAVNPDNTLGASKLLAEKMVLDAAAYGPTKFSVVRFGNVIGSRGSVYQIWRKAIKENRDINVFSKKMTRFIMSLNQAAELIQMAEISMKGGEIFVLRMKAIGMDYLAHAMKEYFKSNSEVLITDTHRKGEKFHERLVSNDEYYRMVNLRSFIAITSDVHNMPDDIDINQLTSNTADIISRDELFKVFKELEEIYTNA